MKTATISEAKDTLGALIDEVKGGETVVITEGGIPVAELVAAIPSETAESDEEWIESRYTRGILTRPRRSPLTAAELDAWEDRIVGKPASGLLDALLAEREEGR